MRRRRSAARSRCSTWSRRTRTGCSPSTSSTTWSSTTRPWPSSTAARGQGPEPTLENAATRFCQRWVPRLLAADWDGLRATFAVDMVGLDHRGPLLGGTPDLVGREANIEANKGVIAVGVTSLELTPIVLGGDRVA